MCVHLAPKHCRHFVHFVFNIEWLITNRGICPKTSTQIFLWLALCDLINARCAMCDARSMGAQLNEKQRENLLSSCRHSGQVAIGIFLFSIKDSSIEIAAHACVCVGNHRHQRSSRTAAAIAIAHAFVPRLGSSQFYSHLYLFALVISLWTFDCSLTVRLASHGLN